MPDPIDPLAPCTPEATIPPAGLPDIPDGIAIATVTDGCVDGNGIYDVFMRAHMDAIHQEYAKQRIKGSEYSKVYLGGMQTAMQNAVSFALGKDEAASKAELARYAILKSVYEIELTKAQVCLVNAQIDEMRGKAKLVEIQGWVELAKIHDTPNLAAVKDVEELRDAANGVIGTDPVDGIDGVFKTQMDKTIQEEKLLTQKTTTEHSQTYNSPEGSTVIYKGQALKQRNLLQRQADGFVRDAEAKAAKMTADAYNIEYSTTDGEGTNWNGSLDNAKTAFSNAADVASPDEDLIETVT